MTDRSSERDDASTLLHRATDEHPASDGRRSPAGRPSGAGGGRRSRLGRALARLRPAALRTGALAPVFALAFLAAPGTALAQKEVTFTWEVDGTGVTEHTVAEDVTTVNLRLKATLTDGTSTRAGASIEVYPNSWGGTASRNIDWSFTGGEFPGGEHSFGTWNSANHAQTRNFQLTISEDGLAEKDETINVS